MVQATYDDLCDILINDYGWTEDEWKESYGSHIYFQYIGLMDKSSRALLGHENGVGRSDETGVPGWRDDPGALRVHRPK